MDIIKKITDIIEKRKNDAIIKSITQKAITISKKLGDPISEYIDYEYPELYTEKEYEEDFDNTINGYIYNKNFIEILYMIHLGLVRVKWNGNTVFQDIYGDIQAYNPQSAWEEWFEYLYVKADERAKDKEEANKKREEKIKRQYITEFLDRFKTNWGIK